MLGIPRQIKCFLLKRLVRALVGARKVLETIFVGESEFNFIEINVRNI